MGAMVSQITSLNIVYSAVYSGADQRKHQSSTSLAFVRGIHRGPVNSRHKGPVTRKMFPFDDIIMTGYNDIQIHCLIQIVQERILLVMIWFNNRQFSRLAIFMDEYSLMKQLSKHLTWIIISARKKLLGVDMNINKTLHIIFRFNPLWPRDSLWWHRSRSTPAQTGGINLSTSWLLNSKVLWHSTENNSHQATIILCNDFENHILKISITFLRDQWVNDSVIPGNTQRICFDLMFHH